MVFLVGPQLGADHTATLASLKFWVIEGVPKDKYYLYGKIQLFIDRETYQGAWNRKFSWNGELLNTLQVMVFDYHKYTRPDGISEYIQGSNMSFQCAENIKANRATIAGIQPLSFMKDPASDRKVPFEANYRLRYASASEESRRGHRRWCRYHADELH